MDHTLEYSGTRQSPIAQLVRASGCYRQMPRAFRWVEMPLAFNSLPVGRRFEPCWESIKCLGIYIFALVAKWLRRLTSNEEIASSNLAWSSHPGRVVKAVDLKSTLNLSRRFESCG